MYHHHFHPAAPPSEAMAVEALYAMGHSLHAQDRFAESAAVFRIMLKVAPADERSWLGLGECHERLGQLDVALELYGAGTIANEDAARCELARARVLREMGDGRDADEAFDAAAEIAERIGDRGLSRLVEQERRAS